MREIRYTAAGKPFLAAGPSFSITHADGHVVIEGDRFVGRKGAGRFLRRGPSLATAGL